MRSVSFAPDVQFDFTLAEAFPKVDPQHTPFGSRVLVQMRTSKPITKGKIVLADETRDTIKWNTQVGKVIAVGALAFRNRTTRELWPEGAWFDIGDFVRTPKFGGDKWEVDVPGSDEKALFALFNDLDFLAKVTCDPRDIIAFI